MRCGACADAIERAVRALPGVQRFSVNAATARASVDWEPGRVNLTSIFGAVKQAGFTVVPLAGEVAAASYRTERRTMLKRMGFAGLAMMQTMMFVYALYAV